MTDLSVRQDANTCWQGICVAADLAALTTKNKEDGLVCVVNVSSSRALTRGKRASAHAGGRARRAWREACHPR